MDGIACDHRSASGATDAVLPHVCWTDHVLTSGEARFLQGPRPLWRDALSAAGTFSELIKGFLAFRSLGPCVTVFGSARIAESHEAYGLAHDMGRRLAELGFAVMTGGGPGVMEAANRGAREAGGVSVGCGIRLPGEAGANTWIDRWIEVKRFFVRKVLLVKSSCAFVVFPGGFGTLDELFEAATLRQTGRIHDFPVILMGRKAWTPLLDHLRTVALRDAMIAPADLASLLVTDSPAEAMACIVHCAVQRFGMRISEARPAKRD